jgi:hypothetical protein
VTFPSFPRRGNNSGVVKIEPRSAPYYVGILLTEYYGFALSRSRFAPVCA